MTRWTILIETGWCGIGISGGMIPEIRLGIVRIAVTRDWLTLRIAAWRRALDAATQSMGVRP